MKPITMAACDVMPEDYDRVKQVLSTGQISPGPFCREFETKFAEIYSAKHAIFVNSGTDALRLSLLAMKEKYGWPDGSKVAVPTITFPATVNIVIQSGLTPFFVDVGMYDFNMNPWNLERRLEGGMTDGLVCILPAHLFGQQAEMSKIMKMAHAMSLKVLEDSCETVGAGPLWGDVACFSTYQAHIVATGVGGLAVTNDPELNEIIRSLANHGRDTEYLPGYRVPPLTKEVISKRFLFPRNGYSCRATEFEAAIGIGQLERLNWNITKRRQTARHLIEVLRRFNDLVLPIPIHPREHSYMMFPISFKGYRKNRREDLVWHLEQNGVQTRDLLPITTQPCFKKYFREGDVFPVADWLNRSAFYIPCTPEMESQDVERVGKLFAEALKT